MSADTGERGGVSAVIRTPECYPTRQSYTLKCLLGVLDEPDPQPDHEHCPGGHHMPGVLGGWHCPCPCHRKETA